MKQITLSKKEKKGLNTEIEKKYGIADFFQASDFVVLINDKYILKDGDLMFFYTDNDVILPSLKLVQKKNFLLNIVVDMGAVPYVAKGADLMRPGIVGVDADVTEGCIVAIVDEKNMKPIAIGQSLFSKPEMEDMEVGKMVLNLHYVGDEVWNFAP